MATRPAHTYHEEAPDLRGSLPPCPIQLNAIVTQRIEVAPGLIILRVSPDGWDLPEFEAGQFAVLGPAAVGAARADVRRRGGDRRARTA